MYLKILGRGKFEKDKTNLLVQNIKSVIICLQSKDIKSIAKDLD